ncbi:MAG: IPT/TIG domain-containing protein [Actinobacteria bacterium]|nr:IPT/TIG domain-containing protein [Actinomycetota bacterium]
MSALALLGAGTALTAGPAFATVAPSVDGPTPMSGPTTGGTPVRIYGSAFTGATSVKFGTLSATSFTVVDDKLITAILPSGGTNNSTVDLIVTTPAGTCTTTGTSPTCGLFYYTNATYSVSPNTGLTPGASITATLAGYIPSASVVVPEFNPLMVYLEGGPAYSIPPPYAQVLGSGTTSASGGLTFTHALPNPFKGTSGSSYDPNIVCPVNQTTANYLGNSPAASLNKPSFSGRCHMGVNKFGAASLEVPITYTTEPTPAAPTLTISPTTGTHGTVVSITAGANWNANPLWGSSTTHTNPGETSVEVAICGLGGVSTSCSTTPGTGAVAMTRYKTSSTTTPIVGVFSGATLTGNITIGNDVSPCSCFVRVRQYRTGSTTNYLEKTTPLTVT